MEEARRLLLGASVYRLAVDETGLWWQAGEEVEMPADPGREERQARWREARSAAAKEGRSTELEDLRLEADLVAQLRDDWRQAMVPQLRVPEGFSEALGALEELGMVAPLEAAEEGRESKWTVHRWTAGALAARSEQVEVTTAHRRVARYWLWRARVWPQDLQRDVVDLIEARYHLHKADNLDEAVTVTQAVVEQLHTWGAGRSACAWRP